jgi:hypothetical protein
MPDSQLIVAPLSPSFSLAMSFYLTPHGVSKQVWLYSYGPCAVTQDLELRKALHLVECFALAMLKFLMP